MKEKEEAAELRNAAEALVQLNRQKAAAVEAYENARIAHGYLQGKGYLTVTGETSREAEMLETLLNFNEDLNKQFLDRGNTLEYRDKYWEVAMDHVSRQLLVVGIRDPHFVEDDGNALQVPVERLRLPE
jgi:hypothetical protein